MSILKRTLSVFITATLLLMTPFVSNTANAAKARVSVHDPSIVKLDDESYYIIGSHLAAAKSTDLQNWTTTANSNLGTKNTTFFKDIYTDLSKANNWANTSTGYDLSGNLWAPDIIWNTSMKKWCMYLSVNGDNWHSSIVMCTSNNIDGPYTYSDTIVYSGFETKPVKTANNYKNTDVEKVLGNNPDLSRYLNSSGKWNADYGTNAIDPCTFYDEAGKLWMVYGSWFGGIYMLELDESNGLRDYNVKYDTKTDISDAYMGTKVAGGHYASGEGPYIEYMKSPGSAKGYYYLFVSYGYFNSNGGYNMRIFRSENPNGPYTDQNGNSPIYKKVTDDIGGNVGERLMSNYQWSCNDRPNKAQGHNSVLMDNDGKLFVIYHNKFDDAYGFHEVRVHQMFINEDGWPVASPYEYSGETISKQGYSEKSVTGNYEFIFHTLNQKFVNEKSADVEKPKSITLNSDGSVSGDLTGKWTMKNGSADMTFTYNNVTYKGNFILQADESAENIKKMTFTATGNNTCIWGSKKSAYNFQDDMLERMSSSSKLCYSSNVSSAQSNTVRLGNTNLLSGVSYNITNVFSGKALDLTDGKTNENSKIQQWNLTGGQQQEWRIISTSDGYCKIVSMSDENMALSVNGNDGTDALDIVLKKYTGADNQQWKLIEKYGSYGICSKCSSSSSCIDVYGWSTENGGTIKQYNYWGGNCQIWNITPVYPYVNDGTYAIRNINSGMCISSSDGNTIQSEKSDKLKISRLENGNYTIRTESGKALTVKDSKSDDGQDIQITDYTGDKSQQFKFYANEDGSYTILTAVSSYKSSFDVYGISIEAGAKICQWNFWGGTGQKFILEPETLSEELLKGDANLDGTVDISDVVTVRRYLTNSVKYPLSSQSALNSDVHENGNGVNAQDAVTIQKKILGLIETL